MDKRILCIYNGTTVDGWAGAWAIAENLGWGEVELRAVDYTTRNLPSVDSRKIIMVGISYAQPVMRELCAKALSIVVLEHKLTAIYALQPLLDERLIDGLLDTSRSACILAWDWAQNLTVVEKRRERPRILRHVQDRHLWTFLLDGTREVMAAVLSYPQARAEWDWLVRIADLHELRRAGQHLLRQHDQQVSSVQLRGATTMVLDGIEVPCCNAPHFLASDIGQQLAKGQPFAVVYWDEADTRQYSLRSDSHGMDVGEIAKKYGGGGGPHSAGFQQGDTQTVLQVAPAYIDRRED